MSHYFLIWISFSLGYFYGNGNPVKSLIHSTAWLAGMMIYFGICYVVNQIKWRLNK